MRKGGATGESAITGRGPALHFSHMPAPRLLNRPPLLCPVRSPARGRGVAVLKFDGRPHPDAQERNAVAIYARRAMPSRPKRA